MTLLAAGSLANIYAALDTYLTAQLATTEGLALRLHGQSRFIPPIDDPWVEAHYDFLGLQSEFLRQIGGSLPSARWPGYDESVYGTFRIGQLQLNIFQRARVFRTRYTTAAARDLVVNAFPDGAVLPVYAMPTDIGQALVGNILVNGLRSEHVVDSGYHSGVIQHILQIDTRYLEAYTRG